MNNILYYSRLIILINNFVNLVNKYINKTYLYYYYENVIEIYFDIYVH